ncbi:MAG: chemotaxis protein CheA [Alphaproteobacteria bacterium]|nr:chemotaxis protein CheA [Alphaproteobacteria bacterium]
MSSDLDQILVTFFEECEDLLASLQENLGLAEIEPQDSEQINSIFRAVHSIKGGAGAFHLETLVKFAHGFETVLNDVRNGDVAMGPEVIAVFWQSSDMLSDLIGAAQSQSDSDEVAVDDLLERLIALRPTHLIEAEPEDLEFTPIGAAAVFDLDLGPPLASAETVFNISFKPKAGFYQNGHETLLFLRSLEDLGQLTARCNTETLPDFDDFESEAAYFSWEIELRTEKGETDIREIFEFAEGHFELDISTTSPVPSSATTVPDIPDIPDIAEIPLPEVTPPVKKTKSKPKKLATVRVDVERIDQLINLVGELVVAQAILTQCIEEMDLAGDTELLNHIDELKVLSREIQDSVMTVRAQSVKPLFQRMSRIVREAAAATEKLVRLEIVGDTTEIDKTVIEKLADPLTHMLRNAVDHGLETPKERRDAGKDETGVVTLSAAHRSGRVVIDVSDDGGGIDRARVLQIAIDKGLISPGDKLEPEDIDSILFLPGFSTVGEVSELSGRGVGMDVVKTAIQSLGGQISMSSKPGKGSKFSISLPLTLAVLDGMVVEVEGERFILPITSIRELVRPGTEKIHQIDRDFTAVSIRGENIRVIDVGRALGIRSTPCVFEKSILVLVEVDDGSRCALAFDAIQDQRQVVIKSLETNYTDVLGVAAATILGDGRIALILDPNDPVFGAKITEQPNNLSFAKAG